jgi:signal transduction histidine kinase
VVQGNAIFSGMDAEFSEILSLLDQTIRYTRDLTVEISPPVLYDLGLAAAIEWQTRRACNMYDLKVSFSESGAPQEVSEHVKVFAFKAVQELIRNVVRHARATRAEVALTWRGCDFEIVVEDDGQGLLAPDAGESAHTESCFGLFSIRERLSYIGGTLDITSSLGRGTRVSIASPYGTTEGQP